MKTLPKVTTVDTTNLQTGELIHMYFALYNVISTPGLTSMINVVCASTRMLWVIPNVSNQDPVRIICFILTTLKNEKHPRKRVGVDEDGALENSTDVTNLLFDDFNISMENTVGDASWINVNNGIHNRSIHNMVRAGLINSK